MNGEYIMDNYDPYNFNTQEEYDEFYKTIDPEWKPFVDELNRRLSE